MIDQFFGSYEQWKENMPNRYVPPEEVERLIFGHSYDYEVIGRSFENRPIYKLSLGNGPNKILLWSQMHGNETSATRAMFDLWSLFHQDSSVISELLKSVTIHYIPQLNPDGAKTYRRRNAAYIDINRDFINAQSPEMQCLKELVEEGNYDFLFNLHDQRTIFHPENSSLPATLSFLAPVTGTTETMSNRVLAQQLIGYMIHRLVDMLPGQMARFSDEFYPKATGDNFQKMGIPTILIESGHYPEDYNRNQTRKYTSFAILSALEAIHLNLYKKKELSTYYERTPRNAQKAIDIIYKDVKVENDNISSLVDIGIQYKEKLNENAELIYKAKIQEVGDLSEFIGYDIYHTENRVFKNNMDNIPNIGATANFELGDWHIVNGKPKNLVK